MPKALSIFSLEMPWNQISQTNASLLYEKEEQEKLVAAFTKQKGNKFCFRYGWGAVLILETGLRAGEAQVLEWSDIDVENRTLKVNKNKVRVDGKNVVQRTTKLVSSKRTFPLISKAMEAIQHLKTHQVAGFPYVFATQTGSLLVTSIY